MIGMKSLFTTWAVLLLCLHIHGQTAVSETTAKKAAINWMEAKGHTRTIDTEQSFTNQTIDLGEALTFYVFNFVEGGFAIVPATKHVIPVLAYNSNHSFQQDLLNDGSYLFMHSFNEAIAIHLAQNVSMENAATEWNNLLTNVTISCNQSTLYPSLLEHYQTSRWAGWSDKIYDNVTEFHAQINPTPANAALGGTCVPTAFSQLCRYYRHPFVASGLDSHTMAMGNAAGQTNSTVYAEHGFDYDLMPYRIQNQGPVDGFQNGDPNAWTYLYPSGAPEFDEIGYLTWNLGVMVEMNWYSPGTYGTPKKWADSLVFHYGYTWNPATDYVETNQPSTFKQKLRASLDAERPVICAGFHSTGGHCFLYSGYECDNYFYANLGFGGNSDGFYYIFQPDANSMYMQTAYTVSQKCATNVRPNCNLPYDHQVTTATYANMAKTEQALHDLTISTAGSSVTVNNTAELFFIGGNSVTLGPGTEVVLGGKAHVSIENCQGPEGP